MVKINTLYLALAVLVAPGLAAPVPDNDNDKRLLQYSYVPDYPAAETDDQGAAKEKKRLLQYSYVPDYPAAETDEQGATKEKKRLLQYSYVPDYPAGETQDEEAK